MKKLILLFMFVFMIGLASATYNDPTFYWAFDEASGGTAVDTQGLINLSRNTSTTEFIDGKLGNALLVNASNVHSAINDSTIPADFALGTGDFTIVYWFNASLNPSGSNIGMLNAFGGAANQWQVSYQTTGNHTFVTDSTARISTNVNLNDGDWHRVVWVRDGTGVGQSTIYVDNAVHYNFQVADDLTSIHRFGIGSPTFGTNPSFTLDDFRIYKGYAFNTSDVEYDWNSGNGRSLSFSPALVSPSDNSFQINSSLLFNATAESSVGWTLQNATLWLYNETALWNQTTIDVVTDSSASAEFNLSGFSLGNYTWNVEFCQNTSSNTECSFADSNYSMVYGYIVNARTFNANAPELSNQTFTLNITSVSGLAFSGGTLTYNNTNYTSVVTAEGDNTIFTNSLTTPAVSGTTIMDFYWSFVLSNGETASFTDTTQQQTLTAVLFGLCNATIATPIVNYSIYDEVDATPISTNTFDATFNYNTGGDTDKTESFNLTNQASYTFCGSPADATFYVDAEIDLDSTSYQKRPFQFPFEVWTNITTNQSLYIINDTSGTDVIIEVKNIGLEPLIDHLVKIYRKIPGTGEERLVEHQVTDEFGRIVPRLVETNVRYKIEIYDSSNRLVQTINEAIVACKDVICVEQIIVEDTTDNFADFSTIDGLSSSLNFNNNTNVFTFVWIDNSGDNPTYRLEVQRRNFNATTYVCNSTSTDLSDSMTCSVGASRSTYFADVYRKVGSDEIRIHTMSTEVGSIAGTFSFEGIFWGLLLLMGMILIGIFYPPAGIVLYLFGVFMLGIFDIVFINVPIMIAQIVIGVLAIWAFRG